MKIKNILSSVIALALFLAISVFSMTGCNITLDSLLGITSPEDSPVETVKYTVTFDSNGGSAVAAKTVDSGKKASVPVPPTKAGYVFAGWYLGEELWVFSEKAVTENITLKAKWNATNNDITVTFDSNGGSTVSSAIIPASGKIAEPVVPTKSGYTFDGWYIGEAKWDFASNVTSDSITLKAKWKLASYTVSYELGEGVNAEQNPTEYTIESELITLLAPTLENFKFIGWTFGDVTDPVKNVTVGGGEIGDKTFTANWEPLPEFATYNIVYNLGGGTNAEQNPATYTEGAEAFSLVTPTRAHYEFLGWTYDGASAPMTSVIIDPSVNEGDMTFTANWAPITYTIKYVLYGGEHIGNATTYTVEDLPLSIKPAKKNNLHFIDWYADESYLTPASTINSCANITLYAKFIEDTPGLEYTLNETGDGYIVTKYTGPDRQVYITYYHNDIPVVGLADNLFLNSSISDIVIPEGVKSIGASAFSGCTSLSKISLPSTITYIGSGAFSGCSLISACTLYNGIYYLGNTANPYTMVYSSVNTAGTSVTVHADTKIIYTDAFSAISGIQQITLPEGVVMICDNAFSGLKTLTSLNIPSTVKNIGAFAFHNCIELNYTVENGVKYIGNEDNPYLVIISVDEGLQSLTVKEETKIICAYAFSKYTELTVTYEAGSSDGIFIHTTGNAPLFAAEEPEVPEEDIEE